ncbi:MAG: DUF4280 domain-containing protein [Alphaproteobacteria bacterium]|nr:DUF4280 domain-containing protein [Alphaproteobacteria bacterium]
MPVAVCGAVCACSFGTVPSPLNVLPNCVTCKGLPVATVSDKVPMLNLVSFGMCASLANPAVASATAAAAGVLTPQPCVPVVASPWISSKPHVFLKAGAIINQGDKVICSYAGIITITMPGQFNVF